MSDPPKRRQPWRETLSRQNRVPLLLNDEEYNALRDHCHARRIRMAGFIRTAVAEKLAREDPAPSALSPPLQEPTP